MRLPAVAIAAAFACGIVLGLHPTVARNAASLLLLFSCSPVLLFSSSLLLFFSSFVTIAVLVLAGMHLVRIGRLFLATSAPLWASSSRLRLPG